MKNTTLNLVENEEKFYEFIRILRTHKDNISGFIEKIEITPEQQQEYMIKYHKNYMICLDKENPVGFVGSVDNDIRFAVDPIEKNKGIGSFMIKEYSKKNPDSEAKVLLDNIPSQRVLEKCGYKKYKMDNIFKYYRYDNKI